MNLPRDQFFRKPSPAIDEERFLLFATAGRSRRRAGAWRQAFGQKVVSWQGIPINPDVAPQQTGWDVTINLPTRETWHYDGRTETPTLSTLETAEQFRQLLLDLDSFFAGRRVHWSGGSMRVFRRCVFAMGFAKRSLEARLFRVRRPVTSPPPLVSSGQIR